MAVDQNGGFAVTRLNLPLVFLLDLQGKLEETERLKEEMATRIADHDKALTTLSIKVPGF